MLIQNYYQLTDNTNFVTFLDRKVQIVQSSRFAGKVSQRYLPKFDFSSVWPIAWRLGVFGRF